MAKTKRATEIADVLIGGAGFAGLALAIALRQTLGPSFAVTVADPSFDRGHAGDARASAIAAAARRLFETIGTRDAVAADAQPILDMVVTDSKLGDAIRPVFLTLWGMSRPVSRLLTWSRTPPCSMRCLRKRRMSVSTFARRQWRISKSCRQASPFASATANRCRHDSWSRLTARARRFASAPESNAWDGLRPVRHP